jgi:hypothetical protein
MPLLSTKYFSRKMVLELPPVFLRIRSFIFLISRWSPPLLSPPFCPCCQLGFAEKGVSGCCCPAARVGRSKDGLLLSLAGAAGAIQGELAVWRWCCQAWMSCCPCSRVSAHSVALEMLLVRWTGAAHATVQQRFYPLQVLPEAAGAEGVVQGAVQQLQLQVLSCRSHVCAAL